jgi:hypothetical protein
VRSVGGGSGQPCSTIKVTGTVTTGVDELLLKITEPVYVPKSKPAELNLTLTVPDWPGLRVPLIGSAVSHDCGGTPPICTVKSQQLP